MKFAITLIALITMAVTANADFKVWQLAPNNHPSQMMGYVIQTQHGKIIMIDGGCPPDGEMIRDFVNARGGVVHAWFITHYHDDHTGALAELMTMPNAPKIEKVYMCHTKYEDAKKYDFVPEWADIIPKLDDGFKKLNIFPNTLVAGTEFIVDGVKIEVLRVANPAMHNNFGNNQSCVFKISDSKRSFIFLGDLGIEGGKELLASKYASKLKSDYCQMAHHGQNGCTREVYEAIAPKVCLWPAPAWLWDNDNGGGKGSGPWATLTVRGWMEELGVKTNYTEKDGIVEIK
ncbi:MAG: MBL fold metallo-hydrolase [Abditibacteriota bacterium]|nr:MBL fold metallo-hydrolase [Abditibacteriota bacterium]